MHMTYFLLNTENIQSRACSVWKLLCINPPMLNLITDGIEERFFLGPNMEEFHLDLPLQMCLSWLGHDSLCFFLCFLDTDGFCLPRLHLPLWTSAYTNPYLLGPQPSPSAPLLHPPSLPFLLINPLKPASASVSPSGSKTQSSPKHYSTLTPFFPVFSLSPPPHWSLPRSEKFFHFTKCCTSPGIPLKTHGWFFVPECRENKHCLEVCTQISTHYWIADIFTLTPHFRELFFQVELQELTVGLSFLLVLSWSTRLDRAGLRGFSGLCNPLALWTVIKWPFQCFGVCSTFFTLKLGSWKISQWSKRDPNQKSNKIFNFCFYFIYYQNVNPKEQYWLSTLQVCKFYELQ